MTISVETNHSELKKIWTELMSEAATSDKVEIFMRRLLPRSNVDLFLGVEKPLLNNFFILKVDKKILDSIKNSPESKGILVKIVTFPDELNDKKAVIIQLKDKKFDDIFSSLVADIANNLVHVKNDLEAVKTLIARLKKWQAFLELNKPEGLSEEAVRGLFGELYFLQNTVFPNLKASGIYSWKGFQNTNQDFYFENSCVEVKTSLGREPRSISIASERQLDKLGYSKLFINHLSLDQSETVGTSLKEIIETIRTYLKEYDTELNYFDNALISAGYLDALADKYKYKFIIRNSAFYDVNDNFPKILEKDLKNGVGNVKYEISISECRHFALDPNTVIDTIKGGKNG